MDVGSSNFEWNLKVESWNLGFEVGSWMLEDGISKLEHRSSKLDVRSWMLQVGIAKLELRSWKLEVWVKS